MLGGAQCPEFTRDSMSSGTLNSRINAHQSPQSAPAIASIEAFRVQPSYILPTPPHTGVQSYRDQEHGK